MSQLSHHFQIAWSFTHEIIKFHIWKMMDQMWHFCEWSFLYKNTHYSAGFWEWIYVYENVTYGPSQYLPLRMTVHGPSFPDNLFNRESSSEVRKMLGSLKFIYADCIFYSPMPYQHFSLSALFYCNIILQIYQSCQSYPELLQTKVSVLSLL